MEYAATLLAIDSGVLQALVDNGRKPLSAQELSKKTKMDPLLICKNLRVRQWISADLRSTLHENSYCHCPV